MITRSNLELYNSVLVNFIAADPKKVNGTCSYFIVLSLIFSLIFTYKWSR